MFANCSMPGQDIGMPDVCNTPPPPPIGPIPTPYPNTAMRAMAVGTSLKHLISFMPAHNIGTTIPTSNGDNSGALGGVASGIMMGPSRNTTCSVKVITNGMPATRMLDVTMQNSTNCIGSSLVPGQFKVLYLS